MDGEQSDEQPGRDRDGRCQEASREHDDQRCDEGVEHEVLGVRQPGSATAELAIHAEREERDRTIEATGRVPPR